MLLISINPFRHSFCKIKNMQRLSILTVACCAFLIACNNNVDSQSGNNGTGSKAEKKISSIDPGITPANSYSDLFFDSAALTNFIRQKKVPDSIEKRMRSFYNARNFEFAWFSSDGLTEQARGFWNLHDYATTYEGDSALKDKALQKKMDNLIAEDELSVNASDKSFINTELTLTKHFIQYMLSNYEKGYVKRKEMEAFIPRKKQDALALADSFINKKHKDDKYFEDVNPSYKALKDQLSKYYIIAKQGGWP